MTLNLGNGNQNSVCDTPYYFGLLFSEISLDLLQPFLSYCGYMIIRDDPMPYDYDFTLVFLDTLSRYALPFCEF